MYWFSAKMTLWIEDIDALVQLRSEASLSSIHPCLTALCFTYPPTLARSLEQIEQKFREKFYR
ncbi:MAG: hypothetical protein ACI9CB_002591 [Rhodothermales bacterium]